MADLHTLASARVRAIDQRYTTRRRAVVDLLAEADRPQSIADLLDTDIALAQSSLYRNLVVLERADVVRRILTNGDFARFELAEDLTEHHHHLICSSCGSVGDFTVPAALEADLARALRRVASRAKFQADGHRLDLVGVCSDCA
jgi:Fe2+ or Zn2+ uptake regulation protein